MNVLAETLTSSTRADPAAEMAMIMCSLHNPLLTTHVTASSTSSDFRQITETLDLRCQDVEWFARAATLKIILQVSAQLHNPMICLPDLLSHACMASILLNCRQHLSFA